MEIRRTRLSDLDLVMEIYEIAKVFMKNTNNPNQWNGSYPERDLIIRDIYSNNSYVCIDSGDVVGCFYFIIGNDETYNNIYEGSWLNEDEYGVVHRIASRYSSCGIASFCLNYCFDIINNIKIDTHKDNLPMKSTLLKNGFLECGKIYLKNGDERIAFQKTK